MAHSRPLFSLFLPFHQLTVSMFIVKFIDDWTSGIGCNRYANYAQVPQGTLTIGGCISGRRTSCSTGLDSTKRANLLLIQHKQSI